MNLVVGHQCQQTTLGVAGELSDFIQKKGAPVGFLYASGRVFIAKQFGQLQGLGKGGALY